MATYNVELNNKPGKSGLNLLQLRITKNRRHKRVSLERYVKAKDFNKKGKYGSWIRSSNPQSVQLNSLIKARIAELSEIENELVIKGESPSMSKIIQTSIAGNTQSFIEYARTECARHKSQGQFRTSVKKTNLISKLLQFRNKEDIKFSDLDVTFLRNYEDYWAGKGNKVNTVQTDLKGVRSIIKNAIQEGMISSDDNPFERYKIRTEKTIRPKLTDDDITKLEIRDLDAGSNEWHSRNMFLFAFYCAGMRFSDVLQLRWKHINESRVEYVMEKTNDSLSVLLTKKPLEILDLYRGESSSKDDYVFPFFKQHVDYSDPEFLVKQISSKNALVNKYLKQIGEDATLSCHVSFHISRHSFAYMAIRRTGDLYSVSKSLNHKRLETTQTYLKQSDNSAVDAIISKVFGENKELAKPWRRKLKAVASEDLVS